jgi:hypothetical protein
MEDITKEIIDIGIKTTSFIFVIKDENIEIYEDAVVDYHFATMEIINNKLYLTIERFDDWKNINNLLIFGKTSVDTYATIKQVIIFTSDEMEEDVEYIFKTEKKVWYAHFGYLPYYTKWSDQIIKDFYQLPFLNPKDFLQLENGHHLILPSKIYYQKYKNPIFLQSQKEPSSLRFRTLPSTSFYKSKRPINSMTNLRQSPFLILDTSKIPDYVRRSGAPFEMNGDYFIPVVRYSMGMRQGCYFDPSESFHFIGTFYYWEPDSNIYLKMGSKFEYYDSKMQCALQLKQKLMDVSVTDENLQQSVLDIFKDLDHFIVKIIKDMIQTFYKYYEEESMIFEKSLCNDLSDEEELEDYFVSDICRIYSNKSPKILPITLDYKSSISGKYMKKLFYAAEDELDQSIGKALLFFGIDTVIFGKMAGSYRIVSEVFDVRPRETSLSNLCWSLI